MKKAIWWIVGIVVIVLIVLALNNKKPSEAGPIKIGFIGPLTGDAAAVGQNAKAAVELAVEEVNNDGGIKGRPIEMIYEDSKCNGKDATSAAQKLLNVDKVVMLYGGACSGETIAAASLAEVAKIPELSYCSSAPSLTTAGDYIFRNYPSDAYQGSFSADYLFNILGKKKVAVIYVQTDWGTGVKDVFIKSFKDLGGTITDEEGIAQNATDAKTLLTKVKASNPDAIYFLGYSNETITALKQMTQLGIKLPLFGGDAWGDSQIYKDAGASAEGIMFVIPKSDVGDAFKAKMKAKIASDAIEVCTPTAYDGVKIIAKVLTKSGTNGEAIKNELYKTEYVGGVSLNTIKFDQNGDLVGGKYVVKKVVNGEAVPVTQ